MTAGSQRQGTPGTGLQPFGTTPQQVRLELRDLGGWGIPQQSLERSSPARPASPCGGFGLVTSSSGFPAPPAEAGLRPPDSVLTAPETPTRPRRWASRTPTPHSLETPTRC